MNRNETLKPYLEFMGVTVDELLSNKRNIDLCDSRKIIIFNLRCKNKTLQEIGEILNRTHSTILYNLIQYQNHYNYSKKFRKKVDFFNEMQCSK